MTSGSCHLPFGLFATRMFASARAGMTDEWTVIRGFLRWKSYSFHDCEANVIALSFFEMSGPSLPVRAGGAAVRFVHRVGRSSCEGACVGNVLFGRRIVRRGAGPAACRSRPRPAIGQGASLERAGGDP